MIRKIRINEDIDNYEYVYIYHSLGGEVVFDKVEDAKEYAINELNELMTVARADKKAVLQLIDNINNSFNSNGFYGDGHSKQYSCYKVKHFI